jgi:hypothetical protein
LMMRFEPVPLVPCFDVFWIPDYFWVTQTLQIYNQIICCMFLVDNHIANSFIFSILNGFRQLQTGFRFLSNHCRIVSVWISYLSENVIGWKSDFSVVSY